MGQTVERDTDYCGFNDAKFVEIKVGLLLCDSVYGLSVWELFGNEFNGSCAIGA